MRNLFVSAFTANLALLAVSYAMLPGRVALHFGSGGTPDSWGSKQAYVGVFLGVVIAIFALFSALPVLLRKVPGSMRRHPYRDYWTKAANRAELDRRNARHLLEFGAVSLAFLFWAEFLCLLAHTADPVRLNEPMLILGLAVFLLYTVYFSVKPIWMYRPPKVSSEKSS